MKKASWIVMVVFGLGAGVQAQSFGVGLGLFGGGGGGGLGVSVPLEVGLASFGDIGLSLRAEASLVLSQPPDLTLLLSPLVSYTLLPTDFTPVTLYAGPTLRLFVQDVFGQTRTSSWSFLGGLVGASVSLVGTLGVYLEASLSVITGTPIFSLQAGVRL